MNRSNELHVTLVLVLLVLGGSWAVADDEHEDHTYGAPHQYGPVSFWSNAALFLEAPEMDDAMQAVADAAADQGNDCYEAADVRDFMAQMMAAEFGALALTQNGAATYYDAGGAIQGHCRYRYVGEETVPWGDFEVVWHKYKSLFCLPGRGWWKQVRNYRYLMATPVHQHGDGMIHAHVRYGQSGFDDLMSNPDYMMWWPTLSLYGASNPVSLAAEVAEAPGEWAAMLPACGQE